MSQPDRLTPGTRRIMPADLPLDAPRSPARPVHLADYRVPPYRVDSVALDIALDPEATLVVSRLAIRRDPDGGGGPLRLDGEALELVSVALDGVAVDPSRLTRTDDALVLADPPERFDLEIEVRIAPARNTELSGLYMSGGHYFTQCEAEGFRRITYFPDRPDVMARYTVTIRAPLASDCPVLLSNGNPDGEGEADGMRWARWIDPHPKPSYLFALVAGDLHAVRDRFVTRSGRDVALAIWTRLGDQDRTAHAMTALRNSMAWDEDTFGLEYDLDVFNIVAVADFNMGAMENKGLNIFNAKYVLARPDTATDADHDAIETVVAHEYFHNWTGNRITCRDWFQLSLKEGLTVFRDQEFSADRHDRAVKRIADVVRLRSAQFPEDAGPLAHPVRPRTYVEINNFYTPTVYEKGAELVRMIRTLVGQDAFRRGMDLYVERHDNQAVTIEDFVRAMEAASNVSLDRFRSWYDTPGTPRVTASEQWDEAAGRYALTLRQDNPRVPDAAPLPIPMRAALLGADGAVVRDLGVRVLEDAETRIVIDDLAARPVPSLFRDFSAPIRLAGLDRTQLRFLAAHDDDAFNRWEAGQLHATAILLDRVAGAPSSKTDAEADDAALVAVAASVLADADARPAWAALALALPSEASLGDAMAVDDVDAVHRVREAARAAIGRGLAVALDTLNRALAARGENDADRQAVGRRALKNAVLDLLAAGDPADGAARAHAQLARAGTMTDRLAALRILAGGEDDASRDAVEAFRTRYRDDALVLDKWFAIVASASGATTLGRVRALAAADPDFASGNPNRVYALLGSFMRNRAAFHAPDGGGYAFAAETIASLDARNPQLAARLVTPFGAWRRFAPARRDRMEAVLRQILAAPGLSRNTAEMVARSLG